MIHYPYTLEMWYEEDAVRNPDGTYTEGVHEWRTVGPCNVRQNGQAQQVRGANGEAFIYSYEVVMPSNTDPIPLNTQVRVIDRNGINIFDHKPKVESKPKIETGTNVGGRSTYAVQGFYKSGQRYEDTRLWL